MVLRVVNRIRPKLLTHREFPTIYLQHRLVSSTRRCPSCSSSLPTTLPACPNCFYIKPLPQSISYFDIFDLPSDGNAFKIDTKELRARFLRAQRVCHPDAWSGKGEEEQGIAQAQSSILNTAYRTLVSPVLRAQYILAQHGGVSTTEEETLEEPNLIMEVMEAREELESASSSPEVENVKQNNEDKMKEVVSRLENLLAVQDWANARTAVIELKYLEGVESAAKERLEILNS